MAGLTDELTVPIPCPQCGEESEYSLARLKDDPDLTCPVCGQAFHVDSPDIGDTADQLGDIDRAWDKLTKG